MKTTEQIETPRTDAIVHLQCRDELLTAEQHAALAYHARQLERELTAALAEIEKLKSDKHAEDEKFNCVVADCEMWMSKALAYEKEIAELKRNKETLEGSLRVAQGQRDSYEQQWNKATVFLKSKIGGLGEMPTRRPDES